MFKKLRNLSLISYITNKKHYFLSVLIFTLLLGALYVGYSYFLLKEIEVRGLPKGKILIGLQAYEQKHLGLLNTEKVSAEIQKQNAIVKKAVVTKEYPNKLLISVSIYYPVANLKTTQGFFQLSEDGRILAKTHDANPELSIITYYQNFPYHGHN